MMGRMNETVEIVQTGKAARMLGVRPSTVRRMAEAGALPYIQKMEGRVGGYLFNADVVRAAVKQRRAEIEQKLAAMGGAA